VSSASEQHPLPRLDPYLEHYAARTRGMVASEIRALFAVAARPEVVSLAGGMPYISALPLDAVGEIAGQLVADRGAVALQYGSGQGDPGLREGICEVMSLEGIRAHPDEVVVTVGSQQALDLLTRIFIDPGDVVLAEGPSYVGALGTFASYEANVVHVPMDDQGLIPGALADALAGWPPPAGGPNSSTPARPSTTRPE
jgi:2-aminoadipate transaminase